MAVIQISKIQMRYGAEIELPGQPSSLSPLTFSPGLAIGELGFASDTGRLFIGHNPSVGQRQYQRTTLPYQNVEILTENSTTTLRRMVGAINRELTTSGFIQAFMLPSGTDWFTLQVYSSITGLTQDYRFDGETVIAKIDYYVYDDTNKPVRTGTLRLICEDDTVDPRIGDECMAARRMDLVGDAALDPELVYSNVEFRLVRAGTPSDRHFVIQYRNVLTKTLRIYYSVHRPFPA